MDHTVHRYRSADGRGTVAFAYDSAISQCMSGDAPQTVQPDLRPLWDLLNDVPATASALFLLINNLIGLGGGIYDLGALSKALTPIWGSESLRYSMLFALVLYLLAALLMGLAGHGLRRGWVEETYTNGP